jgi:hypothetical protein
MKYLYLSENRPSAENIVYRYYSSPNTAMSKNFSQIIYITALHFYVFFRFPALR